LHVQKIE
jgi:hypothetical protein